MSKEKVFIVLSHKHNLKKGSRTEWEVAESVEFVNQLRNKHITMSSAIGDYLNRKMISGESKGMGDYAKFEEYVWKKYSKQMTELETAYNALRVPEIVIPETMITDSFGNVRPHTVFDI
jgi:hypothetical protein